MTKSADQRAARQARRAELGDFLRSRRARVSPERFGLPAGPRRRTPGLRREEVAQLAGIGVTWYTWLEQGRPINVSVQVLDAVARTLGLDPAERAHLYRLADVPTVPAAAELEELPAELQTILDHLEPLPACVLSGKYDLLAWNHAYYAVFPGCSEGSGAPADSGPRNILWLTFVTPDCCNPFPGRAEEVPRMVAYLRGAYAKHVGEPAWDRFVERLKGASPEFTRLWESHDVATPGKRFRTIRHATVGELEMALTSLALAGTDGTWIQVYTPADEDTRNRIEKLRTMTRDELLADWLEHRRVAHPASKLPA